MNREAARWDTVPCLSSVGRARCPSAPSHEMVSGDVHGLARCQAKALKGRPSSVGRGIVLCLAGLLLAGVCPLRAQDSTNSASSTDFKSFQIIADRNIFDPTRSGRARRYSRRRPAAQAFTFCGLVWAALDKQPYAVLFDGYGSPGRQLYVGDVINGFKIVQIPIPSATNGWRASVQLAATNHTITLFEGMHLRREEGGPWTATDQPEPTPAEITATSDSSAKPADSDSDSSATSTASARPGESDILRQLRLKREQEDK